MKRIILAQIITGLLVLTSVHLPAEATPGGRLYKRIVNSKHVTINKLYPVNSRVRGGHGAWVETKKIASYVKIDPAHFGQVLEVSYKGVRDMTSLAAMFKKTVTMKGQRMSNDYYRMPEMPIVQTVQHKTKIYRNAMRLLVKHIPTQGPDKGRVVLSEVRPGNGDKSFMFDYQGHYFLEQHARTLNGGKIPALDSQNPILAVPTYKLPQGQPQLPAGFLKYYNPANLK
ncbi:MAG: hypothetical protein JRH20_26115 [Deltaproteobacteria bacterium]|nr:hypothetical protein [Deltaproteobacteria bacterium]